MANNVRRDSAIVAEVVLARQNEEADRERIELSWHISSLELQEGLSVNESHDTVPSDLLD